MAGEKQLLGSEMNNTGSFPFSPTPKKRVLTEAFPSLAHGGGTCGFSHHGQLGVVSLVFFCFIHSKWLYIFFLARWWFCSYLFGIFTSYFHEHIFWLGWYKPPTADRRFGPIGSGVFFLQTACIVGLQPQASDFAKRSMEKNTRNAMKEMAMALKMPL